ncbi:MAG: response regulator [Myxococcota bacterium]|nr:response regulator [Myxococcota bacterium]
MRRVLVVDDSALVRRVVERVLHDEGHEVVTAADGREGLERVHERVPDLILVDLVMPHLDGVGFCAALRELANARHVPVVLMSARAGGLGPTTLARCGALDAIAKPFAPEALRAVVSRALRVAVNGAVLAAAPPTGEALEPCRPQDSFEVARDADLAARRIAEIAVGVLRARGSELAVAVLADGIRRDVREPVLEQLGRVFRQADGGNEGPCLEGRLGEVALGDVLQILEQQRQTGRLTITSGTRAIEAWLRDGLLDVATSRGVAPEFLLGRYLVQDGALERAELETLLRQRAGIRPLLGTQLVRLGYVTREELHAALVRQTSELLYEALRWRSGRFAFERGATPPQAAEARLGLPVAAVLLEGLRRVDEWRLIEEQIRDFEDVLEPLPHVVGRLPPDALGDEDRRVLAAVDGVRTVREIVTAVGGGSFEVCSVLFRLLTGGLVRRRLPSIEPPAP